MISVVFDSKIGKFIEINGSEIPKSLKGLEVRNDVPGYTDGIWKVYSSGYVHVKLRKDNPYFLMHQQVMYNNATVPLHHLVMVNHLGRFLELYEEIHHRDHNKQNNRIDNLRLTTHGKHMLEDRNDILELQKEVASLNSQNTELRSRLIQLEAEIIRLNQLLEQSFTRT